MSQLFGYSTDNVSLHLKNIFKERELEKESVTEEFWATASNGKKYKTAFYNLDAVIAIGYRVNTKKATQFRIPLSVSISTHRKFLPPLSPPTHQ